MNIVPKKRTLLAFVCAFAAIVGCGGGESLDSLVAAAKKVNVDTLAAADQGQLLEEAGVAGASELPYPSRSNPFTFVGEERAATEPKPNELSDIRVIGFAQVGQPRVMLRLRNETRSLAVGDKNSGVEVLEISPPNVRLKLANLTWNASMFDEKSVK